MKYCLTIIFLGCSFFLFGQSKVIDALQVEKNMVTYYHFYPSTLRMVNINKDPAFDDLIRPIRKLDFLSMRYELFDADKVKSTANQMMEEEGYEQYAEMYGPDNLAYILGKPSKEYTCILARMDSSFYIAEVQGKIDVMKLGDVYNNLMSADSTMDSGFTNVFSMIQKGNEDQRKRDARNKKEREHWEKKKELEKIKQDSLDALKPKESIGVEIEFEP